jgi:translocation protein SEC63
VTIRGFIPHTIFTLEQTALLLQTPASLTSLLSITLAHNWLIPTLHVMHLHAYLAQALLPGEDALLQLPCVEKDEARAIEKVGGGVKELIQSLEEKNASQDKVHAVQRAAERWGKLEIIDAQFKGLFGPVLLWDFC